MKPLYFLMPAEPKDREAWRLSSHAGVAAIHAANETEARDQAAKAFSGGAPDSPWRDASLAICLPAEHAATGWRSEAYFAPDAKLKLPKSAIPGGVVRVSGVESGPGSYTAPPLLDDAARIDYVAASLDAKTGLRPDVEPRVFLENAADVTVLSYPKSGKTWLAFLLTNYIAARFGFADIHRSQTADGTLLTYAPESRRRYLGEVARRRTRDHWAPLVRFVHLDALGYPYFALKTLGAPGTPKHVLLVRDPRDILVSHFHHIVGKNRAVFDAHRDKPQLASDLELGEFIRSDYFGIRHVLGYFAGWGRWAGEANATVVYYEDFARDPAGSLSALLTAIGVADVDARLVREAVGASSFGTLRSAERSGQQQRGSDAGEGRIRRGKAGGYHDELAPDDIRYLNRVMTAADIPILRRYLDQ